MNYKKETASRVGIVARNPLLRVSAIAFIAAGLFVPQLPALAPSTTTLTASTSAAYWGEAVFFTATVTPGATGTVIFSSASQPLLRFPVSLIAGQAQFATNLNSAGTFSLIATYSGDSTFAPSTSNQLAVLVSPEIYGARPRLTSSVAASVWGAPVRLTAALDGVFDVQPTGTMTFVDSLGNPAGTSVAMDIIRQANLTLSNLRVGTHTITVTYAGNLSLANPTSAPLTFAVSPLATSIALTSPSATDSLVSRQPIAFSAQVHATQAGVNVIGSVHFLDGDVEIGSVPVAGGVATLDITNIAAGSHSLSAKFTPAPDALGDLDFIESTSNAVSVDIKQLSSLPQVLSGKAWNFTIDAINLATSATTARFQFLDDGGNPLALPLTWPQHNGTGPVTTATLDQILQPNAQAILHSAGSTASAGWGELVSGAGLDGFGVFSNSDYGWNAVVPLETRNASSYVLAFDNTGGLATGLALANVASQGAGIPVILRDDSGAQIGAATLKLPGQGHTSFMLDQQYPVTAGKRGTVEFDTPVDGRISVLGLRANGQALTTLPVLAQVGTGGGSLTHVAYNGGFTSTFYVLNTGTAAASFTLSFFDDNGNAMAVPLSLPQTNETVSVSALSRTLAAGAMFTAQIQGDDALQTVSGSAQLTSAGNISGFEVFRWTTFGQEASVPVETRTPKGFVLLFDDTNGLTTGVALANLENWASEITVTLRDDTGALLQTGSLTLSGQGHTSFELPAAFPTAANVRGSVEFLVPIFGKISVIGLRAKSDGTLTTIPTLVR